MSCILNPCVFIYFATIRRNHRVKVALAARFPIMVILSLRQTLISLLLILRRLHYLKWLQLLFWLEVLLVSLNCLVLNVRILAWFLLFLELLYLLALLLLSLLRAVSMSPQLARRVVISFKKRLLLQLRRLSSVNQRIFLTLLELLVQGVSILGRHSTWGRAKLKLGIHLLLLVLLKLAAVLGPVLGRFALQVLKLAKLTYLISLSGL